MSEICIFAGTSEGHGLTERLAGRGANVTACVATDYGASLLKDVPGLKVTAGRLDRDRMEAFFRERRFDLVIDATHPYADQATENIAAACAATGTDLLRVERPSEHDAPDGVFVPDVPACVEYLSGTEGEILLTTGSKDLPLFAENDSVRPRLHARVLPMTRSLQICEECGIDPSHVIAMQGPFDEELNVATLKACRARYLVTKDTGEAGGYRCKIAAARRVGATAVIIGRPPQREGLTAEDALKAVEARFDLTPLRKKVTLAGIGPGGRDARTIAVDRAIREADCLIGAKRMLQDADGAGKRLHEAFLPDDVARIIREDEYSRRFVVLLSGDTGFFSGAKKLIEALKEFDSVETEVLCGVSSMQYLMSRIGRSYEDTRFLSLHGREGDIAGAARENRSLFVLVGGKGGAKSALSRLTEAGLGDCEAAVGERLGYPDEKVTCGTAAQLAQGDYDPLSALYVENASAAPDAGDKPLPIGLPDEAFERDETPMTKSEVRSVSMSKLRLTPGAVVYDVGSGSGSVTVEAALIASRGTVCAIEMKPQAVALTKKNVEKFGLNNVVVVEGRAPEAFEGLPAPTHAFIGGSSGSMADIVKTLLGMNPAVRIVANAVTLESISELNELSKTFRHADVAEISVSKPRRLGRYNLMTAHNPVYVFALWNTDDA